MQEKLELKYVAPYLSYNVNVFDLVIGDFFELDLENISSVMNDAEHLNTIRLALRPSFYLTKEITQKDYNNAEPFIPIEELEKMWNTCEEITKIQIDSDFRIIGYCGETVVSTPLWAYRQLLKWHFDVSGLIEKGLAIDINTLEL